MRKFYVLMMLMGLQSWATSVPMESTTTYDLYTFETSLTELLVFQAEQPPIAHQCEGCTLQGSFQFDRGMRTLVANFSYKKTFFQDEESRVSNKFAVNRASSLYVTVLVPSHLKLNAWNISYDGNGGETVASAEIVSPAAFINYKVPFGGPYVATLGVNVEQTDCNQVSLMANSNVLSGTDEQIVVYQPIVLQTEIGCDDLDVPIQLKLSETITFESTGWGYNFIIPSSDYTISVEEQK